MQNSNNAFNVDLERLLKKYLGEDWFNTVYLRENLTNETSDEVSEKISDFYKDQLKINVHNYSERIKIDRTITYSEKNLPANKFCEFLLNLGNLCLANGKLTIAGEIFRKANNTSSDISIKAESILGLAEIYSRRAAWSRSFKLISEAESLYKNTEDKIGKAKCENILGTIYGEMGDIDSARSHLLTGLNLVKTDLNLINAKKDLEMVAKIETNLGIVESILGNSADSIRYLNAAMNTYKQLDYKKNEAEVNLNIALVYLESGMPEAAVTVLDEGISLAKEYKFMSVLCLFYLAKSEALIAMETLYYAAEFADKALELSHYLDDKLSLADLYRVKGIIERKLKNYSSAENYLLDSLRINSSLKNEKNIAETSFELAMLYKEMDNANSKQSYLKRSLDYFNQISAAEKVKRIQELIGAEAA
jgi:tetratricopeptide (TPR) repeat protein